MLNTTSSKPKKTLPILSNLDDIRVASPCHAEWDEMKPLTDDDGARARFCGSCTKNVYDLSSMTRPDAIALITRHEGDCCVRFYRRPDGTVLTDDCPVGLKAALKNAQRKAFAGIAACAGAAAAIVAFLIGVNPVSRKLEEVQGLVTPVVVAGGLEPMPVPEMGVPPPRDEPAIQGGLKPFVRQPVKATKPPQQKMGKIRMGKPSRPPEPVAEMGDVAFEEPRTHVEVE